MITTTIARAGLIDAIEYAISQAARADHPLSPDDAASLRRVAETSTRVRRGDFFAGCGCPAVQAGLAKPDHEADLDPSVVFFASAFDDYTRSGIYRASTPGHNWTRAADELEVVG
jgi:hypothetical protein